jgi:hypothetical protein
LHARRNDGRTPNPHLARPFKVGFSESIDLVFLIAACVVAIGFFVFLFLPQLALSEKSGIQAMQDEAAQKGGGPGTAVTPDVPADQPVQAVGAASPTSTAPPAGTAEDPRR